jgi:hypothetical protein
VDKEYAHAVFIVPEDQQPALCFGIADFASCNAPAERSN